MKPLILVVGILMAGTAHAHDLWLERGPAGYTLSYGHKETFEAGHSHGDGAEVPAEYPIKSIMGCQCFDSSGVGTAIEVSAGYPLRAGEGCFAFSVLASSGYWTKTPYGTRNLPKNEVDQAIKSWVTYETVKYIASWSDTLAKALTGDLEIVPLHNPLALNGGDKLRLLVALDGKPLEGAIVSYDGRPRGKTDKSGQVGVKIRHVGFQMIQASFVTSLDSEKADELVRNATLNFETGEEE